MKKSKKILLISIVSMLALGVTFALAGPVIYRDFIVPPAADVPTLPSDATDPAESSDDPTISGPSGGPLTPEQLAGTWSVSDGSEAGYRVNEVLRGTPVTVTGRTPEVTGALTISDDGLTLEAAEFTVDVASITTDNSSRDSYFRDQALNASRYPEAQFVLTSPVSVDALPASGEVIELSATGDMTIAGVTKSVTATLQLRSDGVTAEVAGSIPITFLDFGVEAPSLGFVKVEPEGFVEFQLVASRE